MKIKVCGLKYPENIKSVCESGADFIGLIFYKDSPRYVNGALSFDDVRSVNKKKVGVFVNENVYSVLNKVAHYDLDYVQLHGNESPEDCSELRNYVKVIKSFGMSDSFDMNYIRKYKDAVEFFLFDTLTKDHGGSGKAFDHKLLNNYDLDVPFFLSGGISSGNVEKIMQLKLKQLYGLDINSKFETAPGLKDVQMVKQFIKKIK